MENKRIDEFRKRYAISKYGFLPARCRNAFSDQALWEWDRLIATLPDLNSQRTIHSSLENLPEFDVSLLKDDAEYHRAYSILSMISNSYVHCNNSVPILKTNSTPLNTTNHNTKNLNSNNDNNTISEAVKRKITLLDFDFNQTTIVELFPGEGLYDVSFALITDNYYQMITADHMELLTGISVYIDSCPVMKYPLSLQGHDTYT